MSLCALSSGFRMLTLSQGPVSQKERSAPEIGLMQTHVSGGILRFPERSSRLRVGMFHGHGPSFSRILKGNCLREICIQSPFELLKWGREALENNMDFLFFLPLLASWLLGFSASWLLGCRPRPRPPTPPLLFRFSTEV